MEKFDVIIIGAGAAGLMCAIEAGKRHRTVLVLDHANKPGKKILMSGGGRCNFTNYNINPSDYISHNPHFCKSALSRYTQWNFIELVKKHNIPFHEKSLGQLFCDNKSKDILDMLLLECQYAKVKLMMDINISSVQQFAHNNFILKTSFGEIKCESLVVATGGLSIPTMGASPFGYKLAEQFNIKIWPTRAGLVPLTLHLQDKEKYASLSGVSINSIVSNTEIAFRENILFTHRGLSGPAILQISSYWQPGETIKINLAPDVDLSYQLKEARKFTPQKQLNTLLTDYLPRRLIDIVVEHAFAEKKIAELSSSVIEKVAHDINSWVIKPNGTEGYRTAEVTLGGVDCNFISSKTMEVNHVSGLYFIGEVLDVTGWLGGFNFQWAWSSGWAAGQVV